MNESPKIWSAGQVLTSRKQVSKEEKAADKMQQGHHKPKLMDRRCHHQKHRQQRYQIQEYLDLQEA